jgi:hypothetical protein
LASFLDCSAFEENCNKVVNILEKKIEKIGKIKPFNIAIMIAIINIQ